jgi:hypothetical protein
VPGAKPSNPLFCGGDGETCETGAAGERENSRLGGLTDSGNQLDCRNPLARPSGFFPVLDTQNNEQRCRRFRSGRPLAGGGCRRLRARGQDNGKRRALAEPALGAEAPVMRFDDVATDGQAQTRTPLPGGIGFGLS